MNQFEELKSGQALKFAGVLAVSAAIFSSCGSDKVLTERPYIPAPSDQIAQPPAVSALPPMEANVPVVPDIPPFPEPKVEPLVYTVVKGDSLWKIARMHGVSMQELAAFNNIDLNKTLRVGEKLRIPPGGAPIPADKLPPIKSSSASPAKKSTVTETLPSDGVYVVKSGDSLWKIARKFNTTTDRIAAANNIDPKTPLQVGQKLKIPGAGESVSSTAVSKTKPVETTEATPKVSEPEKFTPPVTEQTEQTEDFSELFGEDTGAKEPIKTPSPTVPKTMIDMEGSIHEVEPGDTWATIAKQYDVNVSDLKKANPTLDPNIDPPVGTKLIIPSIF